MPDSAKRLEFLTQTNEDGDTALQRAVKYNHMTNAALLLTNGEGTSSITDAQRAKIVTASLEQRDQHITNLVNPDASQEEVREAVQWLQCFPPNGGQLNWTQADEARRVAKEAISQDASATEKQRTKATQWLQTYRTPAQKCDAYLETKLNALKAASTKLEKKEILDRTWPVILGAGVNCDPNLLEQLSKQAEQVDGKCNEFSMDVLQVLGLNGHSQGTEMIVKLLNQRQEAIQRRQSVTQ